MGFFSTCDPGTFTAATAAPEGRGVLDEARGFVSRGLDAGRRSFARPAENPGQAFSAAGGPKVACMCPIHTAMSGDLGRPSSRN